MKVGTSIGRQLKNRTQPYKNPLADMKCNPFDHQQYSLEDNDPLMMKRQAFNSYYSKHDPTMMT